MAVRRISVAQALDLLKGDAQVIDIRDDASYAEGHISGARHIHNTNLAEFMAEANVDKPLIVYCYHGNMSQGVAAYFSQQGFDDACSLDGGFEAWMGQGNPG